MPFRVRISYTFFISRVFFLNVRFTTILIVIAPFWFAQNFFNFSWPISALIIGLSSPVLFLAIRSEIRFIGKQLVAAIEKMPKKKQPQSQHGEDQ